MDNIKKTKSDYFLQKISEERIIEKIKEMKTNKGGFPSIEEWRKYGICDIKTVTKKMGSWTSILSKIFGDEYTNQYIKKFSCLSCQKEFEAEKYTNRKFCSSSCAASFNNKYFPKKEKIKKCKICGILISKCSTYCDQCFKEGKNQKNGKPIGERTIREVSLYPGMAMYNVIRAHAKTITATREQKCIKCGYDLHVQTCHIKPIKSFDPETLIKIVNAEDNLILLCPNCHWEFDHKNKRD